MCALNKKGIGPLLFLDIDQYYDLNELFKHYNISQAEVEGLQGLISGSSVKEYPALLFILI